MPVQKNRGGRIIQLLPPARKVRPWLELQVNGELQLTWVRSATRACWVRTAANRARTRLVDVAVRVTQVDVVERVVGIHTKLHDIPLVERRVLHQRHIGVEEVRTPCSVTADVSDGIQAGASKAAADRRRIAEVLTRCDVSRADHRAEERHALSRCALHAVRDAVHIPVRLARSVARRKGAASRIAQRERQAALPHERRGELPTAYDCIRQRVRAREERLTLAEWQIIDAIRRKRIAANGSIVADNGLLVPRCKAACIVGTALIRVVRAHAQSLGHRLGQLHLECVVVAVLIITVVADVLIPVAGASASRQCSANVATQQRGVVGSTLIGAGQRNTGLAACRRCSAERRDRGHIGSDIVVVQSNTVDRAIRSGQIDARLVRVGVVAITIA